MPPQAQSLASHPFDTNHLGRVLSIAGPSVIARTTVDPPLEDRQYPALRIKLTVRRHRWPISRVTSLIWPLPPLISSRASPLPPVPTACPHSEADRGHHCLP